MSTISSKERSLTVLEYLLQALRPRCNEVSETDAFREVVIHKKMYKWTVLKKEGGNTLQLVTLDDTVVYLDRPLKPTDDAVRFLITLCVVFNPSESKGLRRGP